MFKYLTNSYWALIVVFAYSQVAQGIYFTQETPEYCLRPGADVGYLVGRVFAHSHTNDSCLGTALSYDVAPQFSGMFSINATGWLRLKSPLSASTVFPPLSVPITARCMDTQHHMHFTSTRLRLTFMQQQAASTASSVLSEKQIQEICFAGVPEELVVEENRENVGLLSLDRCTPGPTISRSYSIRQVSAGSDRMRFSLRQHNTLMLDHAVDRESLFSFTEQMSKNITGLLSLELSCQITSGAVTYQPRTMNITIRVLDVNDNPPIFHKTNTQYVVKEFDLAAEGGVQDVDVVVVDEDTMIHNVHEVLVVTDTLGVCKTTKTCYDANIGKTICRFYIPLKKESKKIKTTSYQCIVSLNDPTYRPNPASSHNSSATMVITFRNSPPHYSQANGMATTHHRQFYRNSTRLTRLLQLQSTATRLTYTLHNQIFNITEKLGIIYVYDVRALQQADTVTLTVLTSQKTHELIKVDIMCQATIRDDEENCDEGCSLAESEMECVGACGLGVGAGGCVMRQAANTYSKSPQYSTCTHDIKTCPDGTCDELEELFPHLCPQDCTVKVIGAAHLDNTKVPPRGIADAVSPCWCDVDLSCYCFSDLPKSGGVPMMTNPVSKSITTTTNSPLHHLPITSSTRRSEVSLITKSTLTSSAIYNAVLDNEEAEINSTMGRQIEAMASSSARTACDVSCRTAIGVCLGVFLIISFSLFMLWFTKRKGTDRKGGIKHVGSVLSLSAVPSDYVEERDRRNSHSSPHWSPKGPLSSTQITLSDNSKWEIPRENLTLEKTLGEGEFGLVVKARVTGIDGDESSRTVAVKMLKHCSSQLEEQDLWSEFNLLKDVSHPNVIRLLGACTGDGPFYVIVEYCENGCLLKYLRRCRLEENGYVNQRVRYSYTAPNMKDETRPDLQGDLLTMRDILSFAWQIAKGMNYLSSIKLVHRDLAARNVLVSSGKLLKISDFGLTRDVYEADTYLKKSRGRIPVKWLAPESLYAQIYTTRSDIWSYGIVLWEIVTLGAPPYPGIPPERLYNLLIGGYRMDKPENCTDEMYAVMQKCWKTDAMERPTFKSLAEIFDRILQEKTGYLDLSSGMSDGHGNDLFTKVKPTDQEHHLGDTIQTDICYEEEKDGEEERESGDKMVVTAVCNDAYLTPAPGLCVDREKTIPLLRQIVEEEKPRDKTPDFRGSEGEVQHSSGVVNNNSLFGKKAVIYPSEQMSLLLENGTARFMNAYEDRDTGNDRTRIKLE